MCERPAARAGLLDDRLAMIAHACELLAVASARVGRLFRTPTGATAVALLAFRARVRRRERALTPIMLFRCRLSEVACTVWCGVIATCMIAATSGARCHAYVYVAASLSFRWVP